MVGGCTSNGLLSRLTISPSPHEQYAGSLRSAALADTALARDWLAAADAALAQPLAVTLPMRESGYVAADRPAAVGYRMDLQRGRRLSVEVTLESVEPAQVFVDLFETRTNATPTRVASLTEGSTLTADVPRDGTYVLRVQVELLRSGRYTIVQRTLASVRFPVEGLTARAVQSEFGATRDAGRRQHEGIDIFAARNAPVLAVVDGTARSDTNPLGGNVVWLRDRGETRSFYYAHLARAAFEGSASVAAGDVVGYVGNTGNARTTSPHLHFGIYQRGAVDPLPFLRADDPQPAAIADTSKWMSALVRVTSARSSLHAGTARDAAAIAPLRRATLARVTAVADSRLRVELPDRSQGYIDRSAVAIAQSPLRRQPVPAGEVIREVPLATAPPLDTIDEPVTVDVLGEFNGFAFIRTASGPSGWIAAPQSAR